LIYLIRWRRPIMTSADFNFEKTYIGTQDVIPGTERPAKPKRHIYNTDGY
jgi:hypothetical protein